MITCSWRWLLAPDLGQLYDWTRPSTFIGPVTLVCWDNGSQSSLGRLGPGRAPNVERVTRHAGSQHPALDAYCHGRQRKESASAPRKFQRSR
jgi:hypothetical protein